MQDNVSCLALPIGKEAATLPVLFDPLGRDQLPPEVEAALG
jgi:hypothetical protein